MSEGNFGNIIPFPGSIEKLATDAERAAVPYGERVDLDFRAAADIFSQIDQLPDSDNKHQAMRDYADELDKVLKPIIDGNNAIAIWAYTEGAEGEKRRRHLVCHCGYLLKFSDSLTYENWDEIYNELNKPAPRHAKDVARDYFLIVSTENPHLSPIADRPSRHVFYVPFSKILRVHYVYQQSEPEK